MKPNYSIVDGHGHILPMPHQIPDSIKNAGYFGIIGAVGSQFMTQDFIKWKRPISHETFFIEPRLEWMAKHNIAHTVMLTLSQFYCNGIEKEHALDIIAFQNDFHAELQGKYPKQITAGFVVQPLFIEEALLECERRIKEGLKILCLPTHYINAKGIFVSCTDENCCELYALADKHGLAVHHHPYDYERMINIGDLDAFGCGHITAMVYLTGHFHYQFACKNIYGRFPNARFNLSHGNTMANFTMGRKQQWEDGRPDLFVGLETSASEELRASNVFFDTIVHDHCTIRDLKEKSGTEPMIFGMDSPYPLGDGIDYVQSKIKKYPTYTLDLAEENGFITADEKYSITRDHIFDWLYGSGTQECANAKKLVFA